MTLARRKRTRTPPHRLPAGRHHPRADTRYTQDRHHPPRPCSPVPPRERLNMKTVFTAVSASARVQHDLEDGPLRDHLFTPWGGNRFRPSRLVESMGTPYDRYRVTVSGPRLTAKGNEHARIEDKLTWYADSVPEKYRTLLVGEGALQAALADALDAQAAELRTEVPA